MQQIIYARLNCDNDMGRICCSSNGLVKRAASIREHVQVPRQSRTHVTLMHTKEPFHTFSTLCVRKQLGLSFLADPIAKCAKGSGKHMNMSGTVTWQITMPNGAARTRQTLTSACMPLCSPRGVVLTGGSKGLGCAESPTEEQVSRLSSAMSLSSYRACTGSPWRASSWQRGMPCCCAAAARSGCRTPATRCAASGPAARCDTRRLSLCLHAAREKDTHGMHASCQRMTCFKGLFLSYGAVEYMHAQRKWQAVQRKQKSDSSPVVETSDDECSCTACAVTWGTLPTWRRWAPLPGSGWGRCTPGSTTPARSLPSGCSLMWTRRTFCAP